MGGRGGGDKECMWARGLNEVVHSGRHTVISQRLLPPHQHTHTHTRSDYLTGVSHANSTLKILGTEKKIYIINKNNNVYNVLAEGAGKTASRHVK